MTIKLRTQQIIIDIPRTDSEPWMLIVIQRVEMNESGVEINVADRWDSINKRLGDVAELVKEYTEPVTPIAPGFISMLGLADAIKVTATSWILEKWGGTLNENGDVVF